MQPSLLRSLFAAVFCCLLASAAVAPSRAAAAAPNLVRFRSRAAAQSTDFSRLVALTREPGKNQRLEEALRQRGVSTVQLPCIEHKLTDRVHEVADALKSRQYDGVIVTSPEAASVFADQWRAAGCPPLRFVSVGAATSDVLVENGVSRDKIWQPSRAYASALVDELPGGLAQRYLYPCSALARPTLTTGLARRQIAFTAIPTYTTVPHAWSEEDMELAKRVRFAAVASPSAVKAWKDRAGTAAWLVCIGKTTAEAAMEEGFEKVSYSKTAGFDEWVQEIAEVVERANAEERTCSPR